MAALCWARRCGVKCPPSVQSPACSVGCRRRAAPALRQSAATEVTADSGPTSAPVGYAKGGRDGEGSGCPSEATAGPRLRLLGVLRRETPPTTRTVAPQLLSSSAPQLLSSSAPQLLSSSAQPPEGLSGRFPHPTLLPRRPLRCFPLQLHSAHTTAVGATSLNAPWRGEIFPPRCRHRRVDARRMALDVSRTTARDGVLRNTALLTVSSMSASCPSHVPPLTSCCAFD